ncbi:unnamed protein product [Arctia plantaginis]|uniref:Peptidase S1 domain-containing protein n=1 Tax=Arctia plantaginis TaxID=874455 RepID=A0A8S1AZB4_ARCPL|nr:unnamed protein product [Arctia plantaginis]
MLEIFFIFITAGCASKLNWKGSLRTYTGIDENTEKYPYVVALKTLHAGLHNICTGTLLTPQWVLSAAHCLEKVITHIQYGNMSVPLNRTDLKSEVLQMIQHPRYNGLMSNDIGLLLVNPITMTKYAKLSGVEYQTLSGLSAEYAGFGMIYFPTRKTYSKKKYIQLSENQPLVVGKAILRTCKEPFSANLMCLSSKCFEKQINLPGDSGGPLILDNKIVGIALAVAIELHVQAFTPTSSYITWIRSIILPAHNEDKNSTVEVISQ